MEGRLNLSLLRRMGLLLALLVLGLGVMTARSVAAGQRALDEAEAAFDRGDLRQAVRQAELAASWSAPGSRHVALAYRRLIVIAQGAEAAGRRDLALLAWEAVRTASIAGGHPWSGPAPELGRANQELARLQAQAAAANGNRDEAAVARDLARRLEGSTAPAAGWLVALGVGFLSVIAGLGWLALAGVSPDGQPKPRQLWFGGLLTLLGAACWTLAVYQA